MQYQYDDPATGGHLILTINDPNFQHNFFQERKDRLLAIAWNRGDLQKVTIDEVDMDFPKEHFLTLMVNQTFRFERPADIVIWQYNREFYCIIDHDQEVSCAGFLFYGSQGAMFMKPAAEEVRKYEMLLEVFKDEFGSRDNIQGEMLRMLLKRLIIKLTRLGKEQYLEKPFSGNEYDTVRQFNLLVESHFKKLHQVQDYASLLHKSPKTLSNLFSKYNHRTPLQVIRERIALEGKRLLLYTDQSASQIAYELGFEEPGHFSRFFKKMAGKSPSEFKKELRQQPTI